MTDIETVVLTSSERVVSYDCAGGCAYAIVQIKKGRKWTTIHTTADVPNGMAHVARDRAMSWAKEHA